MSEAEKKNPTVILKDLDFINSKGSLEVEARRCSRLTLSFTRENCSRGGQKATDDDSGGRQWDSKSRDVYVQVQADCNFLQSIGVMDYSLLLGEARCCLDEFSERRHRYTLAREGSGNERGLQNSPLWKSSSFFLLRLLVRGEVIIEPRRSLERSVGTSSLALLLTISLFQTDLLRRTGSLLQVGMGLRGFQE